MNKNLRLRFGQILTCLILVAQIHTVKAQTAQKLDSLFTTLYTRGQMNGTVLIAEKGVPIYEKAFGFANLTTEKPLTNNTVFELASVAKQFTAMAIMQLHEKNKLSYDDDLTKFFPKLPYKGITINHLLHHTSGLPDFLSWAEGQINVNRVNFNADVLEALPKNVKTLMFKPGEQFAYSNTNYVLLALIVEKVSGLSFSEYLQTHIFKPLDMKNTLVYGQRHSKEKIADYALGYVYSPTKNKFVLNDSIAANKYEHFFDGVAGPYGISSNTEDMLKWDQALYGEKLISKKEQELAYQPFKLNNGKTAEIMNLPYGFGWIITNGGKAYMHTGGYPGYMTMIVRYVDKNKTVIILTNKWNVVNLYELGGSIEDILDGKKFEMPAQPAYKKSILLNPGELKALEGSYAFKIDPKHKITITSGINEIYAQVSGQGKAEIYAESETDFFYTVVSAKIKFIKDDKGVVTKLVLTQGGQSIEAIKE